MFEDSVLENRIARKRGWTTIASFALECAAIVGLVLLPLIYTEALPSLDILTHVSPPLVPAPPHVDIISTEHQRTANQSEFVNNVLVLPPRIPDSIHRVVDRTLPMEAAPGSELGIPGAILGEGGNSEISSLLGPRTNPTALPSLKPPRIVRVSTIDEGQIVRRVQPVYPDIARRAHVQGAVMMEAFIDRDGRIENLRLVSGHPLLVTAALDAVRQWRYRPYLLNGSPVEVQTTITVNFHLATN